MIRLTLPYPPYDNVYWAHTSTGVYLDTPGKRYKKMVEDYGKMAGAVAILGPVEVTYVAYRPRKIGDVQNLAKALFDALQGVAYLNDNQIRRYHGDRWDDAGDPRVDVLIAPYVETVPLLGLRKRQTWEMIAPEDVRSLKAGGMWQELYPDAPQ